MLNFFDNIGKLFFVKINDFINISYLFYFTIKLLFNFNKAERKALGKTVLIQTYFSGVKALPAIIIISFFVSLIFLYSLSGFFTELQGIVDAAIKIMPVLIFREIGPVIIAFYLIVRSVTAITAQFGVMRIQREIEAMELMGISPLKFLVLPRVIGGVLGVFSLNIIFSVFTFLFILLMGNLFLALPMQLFLDSVANNITLIDIVSFIIKNFFGAIGIFFIAVYYGFSVSKSSLEIPQKISKAAVSSLIFLMVFYLMNSIITILIIDMFEGVRVS